MQKDIQTEAGLDKIGDNGIAHLVKSGSWLKYGNE